MNTEEYILKIVETIPELEKSDKDEIYEMLEHDEWGVAFEIICSVLEQEHIIINKRTYLLIGQLGKQMDMPNSLWKNLSIKP